MRKKRILFVGEASFLATGYSTYSMNVLRRLFDTGKYEIAEFASYTHFADPRLAMVPWRVYGNMPHPNDEKGVEEHNNNPLAQFGGTRFEEVCLDFKCDFCVDIRDFWMLQFEHESPFRPYYHWSIMPPVDSFPQDEQWIEAFVEANAVAAYTDFGTDSLREQSGDSIDLIGTLSPGADLDVYRPVADKAKHKMKWGFGPDVKIIGTVMRNQKRKLYPDLLLAFKQFLEKEKDSLLGKKTYLYIHTSYPDSGWDIPRLLKETGIGHKVLFSYVCRNCKQIFPAFFQESRTHCPHCGKADACPPNTQVSATLEQLSEIYNLFDVYVQYAICEGMGMPAVEAAACGVPVMAVDYSGMQYVVKCVKGIPIKVERFFRESETHAYRAYPDNSDFVEKLTKFLNLPEPLRVKKAMEAIAGVRQHLTWERTAKGWEKHFDSVDVLDHKFTWGSPPSLFEPRRDVPPGLHPYELVTWGINNVLGEPDKVNSHLAMRLIRDLNTGCQIQQFGGVHFDDLSFLGVRPSFRNFGPQEMLQQLYETRMKKNYWEQRRCGMIKVEAPDYIRMAKPESK